MEIANDHCYVISIWNRFVEALMQLQIWKAETVKLPAIENKNEKASRLRALVCPYIYLCKQSFILFLLAG